LKLWTDIIKPTFILSVIIAFIVGAVVFAYENTRIDGSEISPEVMEKAQKLLNSDQPLERQEGKFGKFVPYILKAIDGSGYVVKTEVYGYNKNEPIQMFIVLNNEKVVLNIEIINHKETPNKASLAFTNNFFDQFIGKTGKFAAKENIDAVSGATISSKAVISGVNYALEALESIHLEEV